MLLRRGVGEGPLPERWDVGSERSIYGLEQALRAQGRAAEADETRAYLREVWTETDTLIRSSRF